MSKLISDSKINAILSLLDDEDETVFKAARSELLNIFQSNHPESAQILQVMVEKKNTMPAHLALRIEELIDDIQFQVLSPQFLRGFMDNATLETYAFLVMRIGYPDVSLEKYRRELQRLESLLRLEYFTSSMSDIDKIFMMSVILLKKKVIAATRRATMNQTTVISIASLTANLAFPFRWAPSTSFLPSDSTCPFMVSICPGIFCSNTKRPAAKNASLTPLTKDEF
jgi:hypothetical protein